MSHSGLTRLNLLDTDDRLADAVYLHLWLTPALDVDHRLLALERHLGVGALHIDLGLGLTDFDLWLRRLDVHLWCRHTHDNLGLWDIDGDDRLGDLHGDLRGGLADDNLRLTLHNVHLGIGGDHDHLTTFASGRAFGPLRLARGRRLGLCLLEQSTALRCIAVLRYSTCRLEKLGVKLAVRVQEGAERLAALIFGGCERWVVLSLR